MIEKGVRIAKMTITEEKLKMSRQIRNLELTNKEKKKLQKRMSKTKERKAADKLRVVWFKENGLTHGQISQLLNIGINTVTDDLRIDQQGYSMHTSYKW